MKYKPYDVSFRLLSNILNVYKLYIHHIFSIKQKIIFYTRSSIKYPLSVLFINKILIYMLGAQWLSGRVLDSRPKGSGFEPHQRHCVVVLEQDTFILA